MNFEPFVTTPSGEVFDVNPETGRITNPGKFEGERRFVPHFFDMFLSGFADFDDGDTMGFEVTETERRAFPELAGVKVVCLMVRDDGFVVEVDAPKEGA